MSLWKRFLNWLFAVQPPKRPYEQYRAVRMPDVVKTDFEQQQDEIFGRK